MAKIDLTAERVRELFDYNQDTGVFTRRTKITNSKSIAGGVDSTSGYIRAWIDNRQYSLHRVAWLYVTGEWPKFCIDHIDGDRTNNRFSNLRDVEQRINLQNIRRSYKRVTPGFLGVSEIRGGLKGSKWTAHIRNEENLTHLGTYSSPELAHEAYLNAKRRLHAGCTI